LQEVLRDRDIKLAEAQKTQVDLLRKQRELDDARRELDLTVEKKVQESLTVVRTKPSKKPKAFETQGAGKRRADRLHAAPD